MLKRKALAVDRARIFFDPASSLNSNGCAMSEPIRHLGCDGSGHTPRLAAPLGHPLQEE